ncbi:MAG: elongation factor P-like protein YeiP [Candidatus Omnitrophica bacterium]|nr:elongation factor P-like protein YeiP [Candidatus Omnitrophota bacterium]
MIDCSEFKRNILIEFDNAPWLIEQVTVQSPSARGASTLYKTRVRNLKTGQVLDKTFRSGDVVNEPNFEKRAVQFLYRDGSSFNFMDLKDYNQFSISEEKLQEIAGYLSDKLEGIQSLIYNDEVIGVEIPPAVDIEVEDCPPAGTSKSATPRPKEARLKTGKNILVPDYISAGEIVRVNTQTGEFLQRVNKK